ncbi:hypothetical protein ACI5KX_01405 [Erythrobacter sp. GH1-10]|uniref:hypothetical protein n=1 Tax=Erythrobacter sp. GH1-10 TaxID=3349334 RepID=UPI003877D999
MIKAPLSALAAVALAASLSACQTYRSAPEAAASDPQPPAFVEAACGGCHAVQPPFLSPNPAAPSFEAIANREGLTEDTLGTWLADAHNYPEVMDFDLEPGHVEQIADYMVTLRREDYVPAE